MIKLVRLDYRLLHGQVCFTWVQHVSAHRVIIVDDASANDELKKKQKAGDISEDQEKSGADAVQKMTDKYIGEINKIAEAKEKEIMEI